LDRRTDTETGFIRPTSRLSEVDLNMQLSSG